MTIKNLGSRFLQAHACITKVLAWAPLSIPEMGFLHKCFIKAVLPGELGSRGREGRERKPSRGMDGLGNVSASAQSLGVALECNCS